MPKSRESEGQNYFIGANTALGFVNDADGIFAPCRRVYIIKGGPGTGKSTWIKRVAAAAEAKGYETERYYCSSDSHSLDGLVIPALGIGLVDGTAPHVMEPTCPGARETILDLGAFWHEERLVAAYDTIRSLSAEKKSLFASVYRYLGVIGSLQREYEERLQCCIDHEKADAAAERLVRRLGKGGGYSRRYRQISSIGMNGRSSFDTFERGSTVHYRLSDTRGITPLFLEQVLHHAERAGHSVCLSRDPIGRPDGLWFPAKGVSVMGFGAPSLDDKSINTERFVLREALSAERSRLRFLARLEKELYGRVEATFAEIRRCHFALEACYAKAMDYDALEAASEAFVSDLKLR